MADFDPQLLFEVLKRLQSDVTQLGVRLDKIEARLDRVEDRITKIEDWMGQIERRITASTRLEHGVVGNLASLHESMDNYKAGMLAMDRRVTALEAHA